MKKDKLVQLAGLWRNKSGKGYSGKIDGRFDPSLVTAGARVLLFANDSKQNDRAPDVKLYLSIPEAEETEQHREVKAEGDLPF